MRGGDDKPTGLSVGQLEEWDEDWQNRIMDEGDEVYRLDSCTDEPPDGCSSDRVCLFMGKYWWDDGWYGMTGPHDTLLEALPEPHIPVMETTTGIWCQEWSTEEIIQLISFDVLEAEIRIPINGNGVEISPNGTVIFNGDVIVPKGAESSPKAESRPPIKDDEAKTESEQVAEVMALIGEENLPNPGTWERRMIEDQTLEMLNDPEYGMEKIKANIGPLRTQCQMIQDM